MQTREIVMVGRWRPDSSVGVDKTIVHLTRQLRARGCSVCLWHPTPKETRIKKLELEPGFSAYELPVRFSGLHLPRESARFVREQSAQCRLAHFHCAFTPANVSIAALLQCPYTLTPNGPYSPAAFNFRTRLKKYLFLRLYERAYLERAAFIHALSPQERADIQRLCRQSHFVIAPNGITLEAPFSPPAPTTAETSRTVLFLGRLSVHHKGLDNLVRAFAKAQLGQTRLVLAGPDFRSGQAVLSRLAKSLGVLARISFPGPVFGDEKWKLLAKADLFVHYSRWEGIPFSVLEAMSIAKPVLVSRGTNLADYVQEHQAGWVGEDVDLAAGLERAVDAPAEELRRRGANARRLVETEFQWPQIAAKVLAGYEKYCPQA